MSSKKKTYAQGEMRPLSALAKKDNSSPKKKMSPTKVPEPPKFPQYGALAKANTSNNMKEQVLNINIDPENIQTSASENAFGDLLNNVESFEQKEVREAISVELESNPEPKPEPKPEYIPEPKDASKPESIPKPKTASKPESKPEPKSEYIPEPEIASKLESKPEPKSISLSEPVVKPLAEYKPAAKTTVSIKRQAAKAPDLSKKAERDAFFSRYTTSPEKKQPVRFPEITEEYIKKQEPTHKDKIEPVSEKHRNPFLTGRTGRPVVSHAKEENTPLSIGAKPDIVTNKDSLKEIQEILRKNIKDKKIEDKKTESANKTSVSTAVPETEAPQTSDLDNTASPDMRETIEGAIKQQRKEREEAKARMSADEITNIQKKSSIIRAVGIMGAIAACGVFLLLGERPSFSSEENRMLSTMPEFSWNSYLNGEYTDGISNFYNDTVPMRSTFKRMISSMQNFKGLPSDKNENVEFFGYVSVKEQEGGSLEAPTNGTYVTDAAAVINSTTPAKSNNEPTFTTTTEPEEYEPPVEAGDSIIIYKKRAISFYGGLDSIAESYANTLNDFKERLPDVNVYSMIAPTAVSFYLPDEYKDYTANEKEKIDYASSLYKNVTTVDAYSALEKHKDEAIYARTDHHWLPLGAYYAAEEFAKTAKVSFTDISEMESVTKKGYCGSMYTYTQSTILSDNPENFTYYKPKNRYKTEYYKTDFTFDYEGDLFADMTYFDPVAYYLVFMLGDDKIVHLSTDINNDRTLVIFKDSYANAMVPCLVGSFSDIYVCDIRYFDLNAAEFCKEVGATDLLFAMNTFSATGGNEECIEQILYYQ